MSDGYAALNSELGSRYSINREIGSGGAAVVYLARDLKHDRAVALKVLRQELVASIGAERFLREIAIAAKLRHPNIVPVFDSGSVGGFLYYVMPYVEGESLRGRMRRERELPIQDALQIAVQAADALSYAHGRGVVHRDVKPENILLEAGHAVLADFGIAGAATEAGADRITKSGTTIGTPAYMSPEQAAGEPSDARSDIYSLACVLYEMLIGEPPFTGPTARAILMRKMMDTVPSMRLIRTEVPSALEAVVTRALSVIPGDRFKSITDFAAALDPDNLAHATAPVMSIAVLPFTNMSADPAADYFSDGIAEEITNLLTKVGALRVASRTSAFAFKHKQVDIREIGKQMGVAYVLEGSVRKADNTVRVTAQLIDVSNGYHLWSCRYDREFEDIFTIEDEIAQNVAEALEVVLTDGERSAIAKVPTRDVNAYDYYLRGRRFFHETRKKSLQYATSMFERAVDIDPSYALAYAGIAESCALMHMYYPGNESDLVQADIASSKALELDSQLSEAHAARGLTLFQLKHPERAAKEFERAIVLDPKQFDARYFYGRACFQQGQFKKAAGLFTAAAEVQEDYQALFFAAQSYSALGLESEANELYRRALEVAEQHLELNPDDPRAATMCAVSCCRLGDQERGIEWAVRALDIDAEDPGVRYNVACLYALEGLTGQAIDCLEEAIRCGFTNREWFEKDPDLASLRDHPRFQALLEVLSS